MPRPAPLAWLLLICIQVWMPGAAASPLGPPDTSSPRATFAS
jgi:hypothetical protein